jgi:hypothetical protein
MIHPLLHVRPAWFLFLALGAAASGQAAYKARPWNPGAPETYPARLTSEGVTIAVDVLFRDSHAARVFDKEDMVTRGIMPIAIIIFNDNDFPVAVNGGTIQLLQGEDRIRTLDPPEVAVRLFSKGNKGSWIPNPLPRKIERSKVDEDALDDLDHKFLGEKLVEPHGKAGGFLYVHIPETGDVPGYLAKSTIYIPDVYREDKGEKMIFFEIELKPAVDAAPAK